MEESEKTHHEPEKKKMVMKIGIAGGGTGAVVLLGVATLAAAAAAIASALIVRGKGRKSGRNHHSHQEVEQSLQTEFPETLNKENDEDNASKEREFILDNKPLSVKNNSCSGTADMDVIKDDSASFLFSENLKVDENPMLEINGGTGDSAYEEEEVCFSDDNNTKRLESRADTDGSVVVVNKEELHLPTFDNKFLLEPESKDETQNQEVEIELNMDDDDAIEGVYCDKIVAENNQEAEENIEWKKNAAKMQFSEEDETENCLDQEIIISSMPRKIVTENYGEGGQELVPPVSDSRLIIEHENTNSNKKESSLLIETAEKFEGNGAIETDQVDDSIHKSKIHLVKQECDYPDAEVVQDYEQEISSNDVKDVLPFSLRAELPGKLDNENGQDNASKEIQFVRPRAHPSEKKNPCTRAAGVDEIKANSVIKEEFHLATFDDKLLHELELKNKMHKHEVEIELAKEDVAIDGVHIDKIMEEEDNQNMRENIEGKQNAVELQFFSEEKPKNFQDQEIVGAGSSMPGTTVLENHSEGGKELLSVFDDKEGSLPIETVQTTERNEAIDTAQVDEGIHNAEVKLVEQEEMECDYPDAEIRDCERKISLDDNEQNAESNAEFAEESLPESSIDGKGNSKMTCMVELTETHNNQPRYSSCRRRILIGTLSALSWFSCTWFFGLSFVKLGFILFLTMIISKIHGY